MNDKIWVSTCLVCGSRYSCFLNGIRRKCRNCDPEGCVADMFSKPILSHGYCEKHFNVALKKMGVK